VRENARHCKRETEKETFHGWFDGKQNQRMM